MNNILITIFLILLVPAIGLPSEFDQWLYGLLALVLVYFIYVFLVRLKKGDSSQEVAREHKKEKKKRVEKKKDESQRKTEASSAFISQEDKESIKQAVKKSKNK